MRHERDGQVLWITGAGSGMGRAAALDAASSGRRIALSGRREDALHETAELVREAGATAMVVPFDVSDGAAVAVAHERIVEHWGAVTRVVLAAGLNIPERHWAEQTMSDFDSVIDTNLGGVVRVIHAVLPGMRATGDGVIVVVSSYSGWRPLASAGAAYSASKTALGAVVATLNADEAINGIRATHLCPGDVDTDFLSKRPVVPDAHARARMLSASDVAKAISFVLDAPPHVVVDELVISPVSQSRS